MPASQVCSYPSCPRIATRAGRCDQHRKTWTNRSPSSRALAGNAEHRRERRRRVARAGERCEVCGSDDQVQLHHPDPISQGGSIVQPDARLLCDEHHRAADREAGSRR